MDKNINYQPLQVKSKINYEYYTEVFNQSQFLLLTQYEK